MVVPILDFQSTQKHTFCKRTSKAYTSKVCCQMVQWFTDKNNFNLSPYGHMLNLFYGGLSNNSYKPITKMAWVRARLCKLLKGCTRLAAASDKVYQLLAHGRWFSPASSTTKTGRHDIAESGNKHQKSNQIDLRWWSCWISDQHKNIVMEHLKIIPEQFGFNQIYFLRIFHFLTRSYFKTMPWRWPSWILNGHKNVHFVQNHKGTIHQILLSNGSVVTDKNN
jgi:hypothetical protein